MYASRHFTKAGTKYCLSNDHRYSLRRSFLSDWRIFVSLSLSPPPSLSFPLSFSLNRSKRYENAYNERTTRRATRRRDDCQEFNENWVNPVHIYIPVRTRASRFINKMNTPTFGVASPSKIKIRARDMQKREKERERRREGGREGERMFARLYYFKHNSVWKPIRRSALQNESS